MKTSEAGGESAGEARVPWPSMTSRLQLAPRARLRLDRQTGRFMLLYPERGLVLNDTGAAVLHLCTGERTVEAVIDELAERYGHPRPDVEREILGFLRTMAERGLIQEAP